MIATCTACTIRPRHLASVNDPTMCRECNVWAEWVATHKQMGHAPAGKRGVHDLHCPVCNPKIDPRPHCDECRAGDHNTDACPVSITPKRSGKTHTQIVRETAEGLKTPRVTGSHAGHDHPATPAARAACRKSRLRPRPMSDRFDL